MRLFIAEKPSLARAIADVLPKPHRKGDGFIECGNGQVVTWCIGHLLEQAQPDAYDSRYARWNLADLPIVPEKWQLQPRPSVTKQLNVIKRFLHEASEIVHAGDPDREGQLLVDEVLDYLQLAPEKRQQVQRCLINDLNPQAVERAIDRLRSNSEFVPLCVSALARARADWLYGINMTRAYTILGRNAGYQGVLSVGRVQTPVQKRTAVQTHCWNEDGRSPAQPPAGSGRLSSNAAPAGAFPVPVADSPALHPPAIALHDPGPRRERFRWLHAGSV